LDDLSNSLFSDSLEFFLGKVLVIDGFIGLLLFVDQDGGGLLSLVRSVGGVLFSVVSGVVGASGSIALIVLGENLQRWKVIEDSVLGLGQGVSGHEVADLLLHLAGFGEGDGEG
jgi:hypothetical protein